MNRSPLRIATVVLGAFFTLQGLGWLAIPARAAAGLGMPLLDGIGRSTQIGDLTSFFVVAGLLMLGGSRPGHANLLAIPGAMLGVAAIARVLAWALHGAAFATAFIAIEVAAAALLFTASRRLDAGR
jgi:hypothetical protein